MLRVRLQSKTMTYETHVTNTNETHAGKIYKYKKSEMEKSTLVDFLYFSIFTSSPT